MKVGILDICSKVYILDDPFKEVQLVQLKKKDRKCINSKCLNTHFILTNTRSYGRMRFKLEI